MLSLYLAGFVGAMTTAWLLKSSILKSSETPFILELPQYRMPTVRPFTLRLIDRAKIFLRQAGTIILCVTLALWVLAHLPVVHTATGVLAAPDLANSVIGKLGHFIEPVIAPLGFNWKIGIGLLSSVLAREVMVSTMGTLYGADPSTQAMHLQTALHHDMTLGGALVLPRRLEMPAPASCSTRFCFRISGWLWTSFENSSARTCLKTTSTLACACLRETPGFRRPIDMQPHHLFRDVRWIVFQPHAARHHQGLHVERNPKVGRIPHVFAEEMGLGHADDGQVGFADADAGIRASKANRQSGAARIRS